MKREEPQLLRKENSMYVNLYSRMRRANRHLIEEIGAAKPESIGDTATRAVDIIQDLRAKMAVLQKRYTEMKQALEIARDQRGIFGPEYGTAQDAMDATGGKS